MVKILDNDKSLPEVKILENISFSDNRGGFNKIFSNQIKNIFDDQIIEVFYSKNKKDVIRGIHFQKHPHQISKIINCVEGEILDFYIDLRKNSLTLAPFLPKFFHQRITYLYSSQKALVTDLVCFQTQQQFYICSLGLMFQSQKGDQSFIG